MIMGVVYSIKWVWSTHLTSSTKANNPAAIGAEAEVPVCLVVHLWWISVDI